MKEKFKIIEPEYKTKKFGNCIVCTKNCTNYFGYLPCCTTDNKPNILCNDCAEQTMQVDDEIPSACPNCATVLRGVYERIYSKIDNTQK